MHIEKDIVILGGGIAGLWLLNRLRNAGYAAVLLERNSLGSGQSIASQGMIHGGMKYTLGGSLTKASESIADMPQHWQNCLAGIGDVDIRGTALLSDAYYLWPRSNVRSRLNAFIGSKAVQGKVTLVAAQDVPEFFQGHLNGPLYRLHDIVVDVGSLLTTLAKRHHDYIYHIDWDNTQLQHDADGKIQSITLHNGLQLSAQRFISTCGEGSASLLRTLRPPAVDMQLRPLQMVVVKHNIKAGVYVHCVSEQLTSTPELTITTHHCSDGAAAWYLGGELAEVGVSLSKEEQIIKSKLKLAQLFPWCDLSQARWLSFFINRAEAKQPDGKRPDQCSVLCAANMLYCWPTKLTLAPMLASYVLNLLVSQSVVPRGLPDAPLTGLHFPGIADAPWDAMVNDG